MKRALLLVAACSSQAPERPSFQEDVLPILAANCIRCHGYPVVGGAPEPFRLDTFGTVTIRDGEPRDPPICGGDPGDPAAAIVICGAASYAGTIALRTSGVGAPMPPRFPLDDFQIETLANWAQTADRGTPRPANRLPTVTATPIAGGFHTQIDDADGDLVAGELRVRVGTGERLVGAVRSGALDVPFDASGIPAGDHALFARIDDGAAVHVLELGSITVGAP